MIRFVPFALGLLAGAVAVNVARSATVRRGSEKARNALHQATVDGLNAIEHSSAKMRARLDAGEAVSKDDEGNA